jgi:hypothetical protein
VRRVSRERKGVVPIELICLVCIGEVHAVLQAPPLSINLA